MDPVACSGSAKPGEICLAMAILVGVPPPSRRIRLPAVVGLLLCGVVIGPHVLQLFPLHPSIAQFFADVGKLLLMFFAGLEIELALFSTGTDPVNQYLVS
jgi:Kef-type K+ transport system membrane component KefB